VSESAARLLVAQVMVETRGHLTSNNPVNLTAPADWPGEWTGYKGASHEGGYPRYQWVPIRSYPTLLTGVRDWLETMPQGAWTVNGSPNDYATLLAQAGMINVPAETYATGLQDALVTMARA
jgi:hypothetical protein